MRRFDVRWLIVCGLLALLLVALVALTVPLFASWQLADFSVTFYRAAQYMLRGENVYFNSYPHPSNGREYPPYAPIWILYAMVPFGALPLPVAEALRFWIDIGMLALLGYLSARWSRLHRFGASAMLLLAPWLLTELSTAQLTPFVFIGIFLSYWGVRRSNAVETAIGLWLMLSKFTIVSLVIFATVVFAWRKGILGRTLAILGVLIVLASLWSPTWILDVVKLYTERLATPRVGDSVLLLPGYPWSQLILLAFTSGSLIVYLWRSREIQPARGIWAVLTTVSLVGALHTFVYDWQLLMLPLALLLRERWGMWITLFLYLYALSWAIFYVGMQVFVPSVQIIPLIVLIAVLIRQFAWRPNRGVI